METTFTITPVEGGRMSHVAIATAWRRKPGFAGWVAGLMAPWITRGIYAQELTLLGARAKELAS